jgi:hypothetical protein
MIFLAACGTGGSTNSSSTEPVGTPAAQFTTATVSGKQLQQTFSMGTVIFDLKPDNTVTTSGASTSSGTWAISSGKLTLTFPDDSLTYTLLADNGSTLRVSYHHGNATVEEATNVTVYILSSFNTGMISGKKLQQTFSMGTVVFDFRADNTVTISGASSNSGTWAIANGRLTLTFPDDSITYTLLADNGATLSVSYHHGNATVEEATNVTMTFVP